MHLYSLTTVPGYSSRHTPFSHKNRPVQYQTSINGLVYNQCSLTSYGSIEILQSDITSGQIICKHSVRSKIGKVAAIAVNQDFLVVALTNNLTGFLSMSQMAATKKSVYIQDYKFIFSDNSMTKDYRVKMFKTVLVGQSLIGVFLSSDKLIFQELSSVSAAPLKIDLGDLGCTSDDTFSCFELCRYVSELQCSPYLIIAVAKIIKQSGQVVLIVIDVLWNNKEYTFFDVYRCQSLSERKSTQVHICSLSFHRLALGVQSCIVICQREEFGWVTLCILPLDHSLEGFIGLSQEISNSFLLVSSINIAQRTVSLYDINALLKGLNYQPMILKFDQNIQGKYQGFAKLASSKLVLFLSEAVYLVRPPILKLSRLLYQNTSEMEEEKTQLQILCETVSLTNLQSLQFLSFRKFKQILDREPSEIKRCIEELFSSKALQQAIDFFCQSLSQIVQKMKAPSYFLIKALLRQKSLIVMYLQRFISYVSTEESNLSSSFSINLNNLFNEIRLIGSSQVLLVDEPIVHSIIKKNVSVIRDNTMAMLTLFQRNNKTETNQEQFSQCYFKYHSIFSKFTLHETLNFFRDHTALAERVALMMYFGGVEQDSKQWGLCRRFLLELLALRRDYHPLIGYLCNDMQLYVINRQHLHHCQCLLEKQKEELQWLPSLKDADYAADKYLRRFGLEYLGSFAPHELEQYRYRADLMVIALPERQLSARNKLKGDTIVWKGKHYLILKETSVTEVCSVMDSNISRQLYSDPHQRTLAVWSQQLELLHQIFIQQLNISYQEKYAIRCQNLKIKYDCLCLTNDIYQEIGDLLRHRQQKMTNEYEKQFQVIPFYFCRLKYLADQFNLGQYISFSNRDGKENISKDNLLESIDLSEILSKEQIYYSPESNKDKQKKDLPYLQILRDKLWKLYQSLEEQSNYQFEVEQQLYYQSFGNTFIQICTKLHQITERHTSFASQEHSKIMEINPLRQVRKDLMAGKKVSLNAKPQHRFLKHQAQLLKKSLRLYLIDQSFKLTHSWLFSFEELIAEAALSEIPMSGRMAWIFRQLFQISTF